MVTSSLTVFSVFQEGLLVFGPDRGQFNPPAAEELCEHCSSSQKWTSILFWLHLMLFAFVTAARNGDSTCVMLSRKKSVPVRTIIPHERRQQREFAHGFVSEHLANSICRRRPCGKVENSRTDGPRSSGSVNEQMKLFLEISLLNCYSCKHLILQTKLWLACVF